MDTSDFTKRLAAKLIEQLKAGTAPWQQPWEAGQILSPYNPTTGNRYRGVNVMALVVTGRGDPRWMTYRQAQGQGWQVCQELELTETQRKSAEEKYNAVGKWLNAGGRWAFFTIFPLKQMSWDNPFRTSTLEEGVLQHMVRNDDWSYKDFFDLADSIKLSERRFRAILEEIVHPEVRTGEDQKRFVDLINPYLLHDGFELLAVEEMSGYPVFRVIKKGGVSGHSKNLIFAANGPKPKLVLADAINNDIRIVKNQEYCLVYDLPIGMDGLRWKELVKWWEDASTSADPKKTCIYGFAIRLPQNRNSVFFATILRFFGLAGTRICRPSSLRSIYTTILTRCDNNRMGVRLCGSVWISCFCYRTGNASLSR
jgi:hypothetical protein